MGSTPYALSTLRLRICKLRFHLSVHAKLGDFRNATITGNFGFVFEENFSRKITSLSLSHCFRKAPLAKCVSSTQNRPFQTPPV